MSPGPRQESTYPPYPVDADHGQSQYRDDRPDRDTARHQDKGDSRGARNEKHEDPRGRDWAALLDLRVDRDVPPIDDRPPQTRQPARGWLTPAAPPPSVPAPTPSVPAPTPAPAPASAPADEPQLAAPRDSDERAIHSVSPTPKLRLEFLPTPTSAPPATGSSAVKPPDDTRPDGSPDVTATRPESSIPVGPTPNAPVGPVPDPTDPPISAPRADLAPTPGALVDAVPGSGPPAPHTVNSTAPTTLTPPRESPVSAPPISPSPVSAPPAPTQVRPGPATADAPVSAPPVAPDHSAAVTPDTGSVEVAPATTRPGHDPVPAPAGPPVAEASPDTVLPTPDGPAAGAATALAAPTMLAPIVRPSGSGDVGRAAPTATTAATELGADPEQVLAAYQWRFHPETLRELVEDPDELRGIRDGLTKKLNAATDNPTRARLLSLRAVVCRILGDLSKSLADAKLALAHAEATGELRRIAIAQARLAHVLQWRGDFAEADRLFAEANSSELPDRLRATMHEHAGRSCYDQGRYIEACNHFERAVELRKVEDPDLIARTELALDAVYAKVAQGGWGPYPRKREDILQIHRPPVAKFSERFQRWGYADADGELAIAPSFADVQPFRDGVAWVRRPEVETWELIDESGELLIDASVGYLGVGSFSDGLAWVSRNGTGSWIAIDKSNKVVISAGFDDVRPFRRGVAAVRRGGWGAVDKTGKVVLPTRYSAFTTALTDGRYVDGFTDEGLAIVDAGGRKGVVDRSGKVIIAPTHPALVIHPVAFLVGNGAGRWGAVDRRGRHLIDTVHPSRAIVLDEIDRLLADTTPVL